MVRKSITLENELGLHARAAAKIVRTADKFKAEVIISRDGEEVNCKSILGVLSLAIAKGTSVELICNGEDEVAALEELTLLIDSKFGEE